MAKNKPFENLASLMSLTEAEKAELKKRQEMAKAWKDYTKRGHKKAN